MRILIADDESNVRFALRVLLEQRSGLCVVGEAADAQGLLAQVQATRPDLVLLDWGLPGLGADELLAALREEGSGPAVIVLGVRTGIEKAALDAGADAFVSKVDQPEQLLAAISSI
jgi:DNA-binding NarL/FixJ family response regulator